MYGYLCVFNLQGKLDNNYTDRVEVLGNLLKQ